MIDSPLPDSPSEKPLLTSAPTLEVEELAVETSAALPLEVAALAAQTPTTEPSPVTVETEPTPEVAARVVETPAVVTPLEPAVVASTSEVAPPEVAPPVERTSAVSMSPERVVVASTSEVAPPVAEKPVVQAPVRKSLWPRALAFCALVPLVWGAYFAWRPPAPMLGLVHQEHLGRNSTDISITFDDAPHPLTTPLLLASLKRAQVRATFFCIGGNLRLYPELAHRMLEDGHALANHSEPHHNLTTVDPKEFAAHIDAGFDSIARAQKDFGKTGPVTRLFRPPGGGLNRAEMKYLYENGYTLAWWSNNVGDWTCPPAWKIATGVKAHLEPGDIILLHDGGTGTPQALPSIVKAAREQGLRTVLMPER